MLQTSQILVSVTRPAACIGIAVTVLILSGCGQPGSLYLPTGPAAAHRATLPQSVWPVMPTKPTAPAAPQDKATTNTAPNTPAAQDAVSITAPSTTEKSPQP